MKKIVLLLIFVMPAAFAEHHRGHALDRLSLAASELETARDAFERYAEATVFTPIEQKNADSVLRYIKVALFTINDAELVLSCMCGDLDEARRLTNQPSGEGALSALRRVFFIPFLANETISPLHPQALDDYRDFTQSTVRAWNFLDEAAWHVNDAIREEIYKDEAFICAGPNNHCQ